MVEKKFKVVKIDHVYNGHNTVKLSMRSRKSMKLETGMPVIVKAGRKNNIAIVQKILRQYVGIRNVCMLSDNLATGLEVAQDAIVTIDTKVSDKAYKAYEDKVLASQREQETSSDETDEDASNENEG